MVNTWLVDTLPSDFSRFFPSTSLFLSHIFFPQFFFQFFFFKEKSVTGFFSHFCFFIIYFGFLPNFLTNYACKFILHSPAQSKLNLRKNRKKWGLPRAKSVWTLAACSEQAQPEEKSRKMRITQGTVRMDSGWMRVARGGSGTKAPPLAARPKWTGWLASLDLRKPRALYKSHPQPPNDVPPCLVWRIGFGRRDRWYFVARWTVGHDRFWE